MKRLSKAEEYVVPTSTDRRLGSRTGRTTIVVMLALLLLVLGVRPAHAQAVEGSQPTREQILQRLSALEAEIAQLKATLQSAPQPAAPPAAGAQPRRMARRRWISCAT